MFTCPLLFVVTVMLAVQLLLILLQPSEIENGMWLLFKHHGMYCFHTVFNAMEHPIMFKYCFELPC